MRTVIFSVAILAVGILSCSRSKTGNDDNQSRNSRAEILSDLQNDVPGLHIRILTSLPDRELPQLENHFADRVPHHPWLFGHLLARYGTAKVIAKVLSSYEAGHLRWGCDSRFPFLAYFLRVRPADGESILRTALEEREYNGCYHEMLTAVSRIYPSPQLEGVAIDAIDDPDPQVGSNAALMLSWYGSRRAENHIWSRLERWTQQWRDHSGELYGRTVKGEDVLFYQRRLGDDLRDALTTAQSWRFDEERRAHLFTLCWTDHCKERFAKRSGARPPAVRVRVHQLMWDQPEFEVAQYHPKTLERFREKISQFPATTVFGWCTDRDGGGELSSREKPLYLKQAKQAVESQGFRFLANPPPGSCFSDNP